MKNASLMCVLAVSLAAAAMLLTGGVDACKGVPAMAVEEACRAASSGGKEPLHGLCTKLLETTPPRSEVTVYALEAAYAVQDSYRATKRALNNTSRFPPGFPSEIGMCMDWYATVADKHLNDAVFALEMCMFKDIKEEDYGGAAVAIEHCMNQLTSSVYKAPAADTGGAMAALYGMVSTDRDRTVLASSLAALIPKPNKTG